VFRQRRPQARVGSGGRRDRGSGGRRACLGSGGRQARVGGGRRALLDGSGKRVWASGGESGAAADGEHVWEVAAAERAWEVAGERFWAASVSGRQARLDGERFWTAAAESAPPKRACAGRRGGGEAQGVEAPEAARGVRGEEAESIEAPAAGGRCRSSPCLRVCRCGRLAVSAGACAGRRRRDWDGGVEQSGECVVRRWLEEVGFVFFLSLASRVAGIVVSAYGSSYNNYRCLPLD
jgi:hypothetical protein